AFAQAQPPPAGGPPTPQEVAALACAAVYGPCGANDGLPPDETVTQLAQQACFPNPVDQRSVERALVYGVLLGNGPPGGGPLWQRRWPGAYEALFHLILHQITPAIWWLAGPVLREPDANDPEWVQGEAHECTAHLREYLVEVCTCWQHA